MGQILKQSEMVQMLEGCLEQVPEHRQGSNTQYEIKDAGLAAFSVFFMQSPSFLEHQRDMQRKQGENNAESLFGVSKIPSDGQIRNLLDPVDPAQIGEVYWQVYARLKEGGQLAEHTGVGGTRLLSMDGSHYFGSQRINCANCRVHVRQDQAYYSHMVMAAVLCAPGKEEVIALEPEFITPQDGHDKQDCEQEAIKRWVQRHAQRFPDWGVTVLADDLHCHQPTCQLLLSHKMHFVLTCKRDSHPGLYEELDLLEKVEGAISSRTIRRWNGRRRERWTYRWVNQIRLRKGPDALMVNWCQLTIADESTGEVLYRNAWATDFDLDQQSVIEVVASGRSRWKIENEGFNVLKNRGYNFSHNYGHGQQYLSMVLLSLLLLAFLCHTALRLCSPIYREVRQELGARRTFFNDLRALTRYIRFSSWQQLICFMHQQLDLAPG